MRNLRQIHCFCLSLLLSLSLSTLTLAQEKPSGALDYGLNYHYSMHGQSILGLHLRAMAVDRVPETFVGRFAELHGSLGLALDAKMLHYDLGIKLGLGLGSDYFVLFLASGLGSSSYYAFKAERKALQASPSLNLPLALGLWVDPFEGFYLYAMAEASWGFFAPDRKAKTFLPFAWEFKLRGGLGIDIAQVHLRLDYSFHQVGTKPWHIVSLGFGIASKSMARLGLN